MSGYQSFPVNVPNEFVLHIQSEIDRFSEAITSGQGPIKSWLTLDTFPSEAVTYLESLLGIPVVLLLPTESKIPLA